MIISRIFPVIALCTAYCILSTSDIPSTLFHAAFASQLELLPVPTFTGTSLPLSQTLPLVDWVEDRTDTQLLPLPIIVTDNIENTHCWLPESEYGDKIVSAEEGNRIFIDAQHADLADPKNASIVIHELTHYAQQISGHVFVCRSQREAEAYEKQNEYLIENGQKPLMDAEKIARMKECLPTVASIN